MAFFKEFRDFITAFSPDTAAAALLGSSPSSAGIQVNELSAMQSAAVAGCVRIISGLIASLPINIYEVSDDDQTDRIVAYDHDLQYLLNVQPNPETEAFMFKETLQIHLLLTGNAYVEMVMDKGGRLAALYQRNPINTYPTRDRDTGELYFVTSDTPNGTQRAIAANRLVHIKGMSLDGLIGMNPIRAYARDVVGLDIGARTYGAHLFKNDASPSGILTSDKILPTDKRKQLQESWKQGYSGANSRKFAVLDGGLKWQSISISPEESQFLQTRGYQRDEIATIFGVPPHMLGDSRSEKASNMEQQMLQLLNTTLKPWIRRWENALNAKLLPTIGRNVGLYQIGFDVSDMECADYETKLHAIATGRQWGIYTANEARKKLGLNPFTSKSKDAADQLWQPVNMIIAQAEDTEPEQPVQPQLPAPPKQEVNAIATHSRAFKDAFERLLKRDKRDLAAFQRAFNPSLFALCDLFMMSADPDFRAGDELPAEVTAFVVDYLNSMLKRSGDWSELSVATEFDRAVRALRIAVYREAAIQKAKAEEVIQ